MVYGPSSIVKKYNVSNPFKLLMHILIIHQAFASIDEPGGTRHYELARYLTGRGHSVTVIASAVSYLTGTDLQSHISHLPPNRSGHGDEKLTILRASAYAAHHRSFLHRVIAFVSFMLTSFFLGLRVRNVDVVWGTSPPIFQGVTAWLLARLKGARFLFEVRDLWPQFAIAVGVLKHPILIRLAEWLERFLYRRADRVMVNSPGFLEHLTGRGVKRAELVPNGADPSMFDPSDDGAEFRRVHQLADRFVVLYAGAHGMSNDLGVVLEAALLLANEKIQIILLGDGKEKSRLQDRAAGLGLVNVTFLPSVPKTGMPAALAAADACLAILKPLDEYKTTYPNKVFDYMAAGRPVVLAIDGVIRTVVEAAGCGLFAQPGDPHALADAVQRLARDPGRSRSMGLAGRKYLEQHFSRSALAVKLEKLLEDLTG
jgi:glycosyltransferase involved in cell wall biosynthesis